MRRKRRKFSPEFKAETVAMVLEQGLSIRQVSRDLDISDSVIREWIKRAKIDQGDNPRGELTTEERKELQRLRRENRRLRQEREIPKKPRPSSPRRPSERV